MTHYHSCEVCEDVWEVKRINRQTRFCQRCAAKGTRCVLTQEARVRGALASKATRRRQQMAKLSKRSKIEIFRAAYAQGWHAGRRAALKKQAA